MKHLFTKSTIGLWLLLAVTIVAYTCQYMGVYRPQTYSIGRLVALHTVTGSEVLFAILLLVAVSISRSKPDWKIVGLSIVAACFGIYHVLNFLIGVEFLLLMSSGALIVEYSRKSEAITKKR